MGDEAAEGMMHKHLLDTSRSMVAAGQAGTTARAIWHLGIAAHYRRQAHAIANDLGEMEAGK